MILKKCVSINWHSGETWLLRKHPSICVLFSDFANIQYILLVKKQSKSHKYAFPFCELRCMWFLCFPKNFGGAYSRRLVRPSVSPSVRLSVRPIHVRPITSLFEVEFRNYFTEMTTMLRRRVARKIKVPTLKVKVTAWPCSKIVSGL